MKIREYNTQIIYDESVPIGGRMKRIVKKVNNPMTAWDGQRELYLYIHEVYKYLHLKHQGFFGMESILDKIQKKDYEMSQDLSAMALASAYRDTLNDGVMMQDIVDYQPITDKGIKIWNKTIMAVKNVDVRKLAELLIMSPADKEKYIIENTLMLELKPQCTMEEYETIYGQMQKTLENDDRKTLIDILRTPPIGNTDMGSIELKFISNDDIATAIKIALEYLETGAYPRTQITDNADKEHPEDVNLIFENFVENNDNFIPNIKIEKTIPFGELLKPACSFENKDRELFVKSREEFEKRYLEFEKDYPELAQFRKVVEDAGYYVKYLGMSPLQIGPNTGFIIQTSLYDQKTNKFVRVINIDPGTLYNGYTATSAEHQTYLDEDVSPLNDTTGLRCLINGSFNTGYRRRVSEIVMPKYYKEVYMMANVTFLKNATEGKLPGLSQADWIKFIDNVYAVCTANKVTGQCPAFLSSYKSPIKFELVVNNLEEEGTYTFIQVDTTKYGKQIYGASKHNYGS